MFSAQHIRKHPPRFEHAVLKDHKMSQALVNTDSRNQLVLHGQLCIAACKDKGNYHTKAVPIRKEDCGSLENTCA